MFSWSYLHKQQIIPTGSLNLSVSFNNKNVVKLELEMVNKIVYERLKLKEYVSKIKVVF